MGSHLIETLEREDPQQLRALREFYAGKRTVITGGMGFIGSNLAIALVELGGPRPHY